MDRRCGWWEWWWPARPARLESGSSVAGGAGRPPVAVAVRASTDTVAMAWLKSDPSVAGALEQKLGEASSVKVAWKPNLTTQVDEEKAQSIMKMLAALDDDDDVQNVFANFEVSDEVLKKLTAA